MFAWCYGALLIMCAGGILGWLADFARQGLARLDDRTGRWVVA